jgi:intron-binding protein aquarius
MMFLDIRDEWEKLRRHDVCFLLTVRPPQSATYVNLLDIPADEYLERTGLMYVRGCEVEGMLDENGRVIEEFSSEPKPKFTSGDRTFRSAEDFVIVRRVIMIPVRQKLNFQNV